MRFIYEWIPELGARKILNTRKYMEIRNQTEGVQATWVQYSLTTVEFLTILYKVRKSGITSFYQS